MRQMIRQSCNRHGRVDAPTAVRRTPHGIQSNQARLRQVLPQMQAKLEIGAINDPLEHEADTVADQVMRMAEPAADISAAPIGISRKCAACEAKDDKVRRSPGMQAPTTTGTAPDLVEDVLRTPGAPLDGRTRAFFEPRFGRDFGNARVHVDDRAAASARAVQARAYTVGRDIVFAAGQFAPDTEKGRSLLAHELAHVVQQGASGDLRLRRMPHAESDVLKGAYSFSTNCGWIDWGHAIPTGPATLISRVQQASNQLAGSSADHGSEAGRFDSQTMSSQKAGVVFSSATMHVKLMRALSTDEVLAVALAIFKQLSLAFETQQEWTDWLKASAFAQEDLPSNIISFYKAAKGYGNDSIASFCHVLDPQASVEEYRRNHDFQKNRTFDPIGATGPWPAQLSGIDDGAVSSLYEIAGISVESRFGQTTLCPAYRLNGRIGATDLFLVSVGGSNFTKQDDVRVVPTYRFSADRLGGYGHFPDIEVKPMRPRDEQALADRKIIFPFFVPSPLLTCLSGTQAATMPDPSGGSTVRRSPDLRMTQREFPPQPQYLQRQGDEIEIDIVDVSPAEAEELRRRGIDLPTRGGPLFPAPTPSATSGGYVSAAGLLATCPAAPALVPPAVTCPPAGSDKPALPVFDTGRFAGNAVIAGFAHDLAACHAARIVAGEVDKRYRAALAAARKDAKATSEAETKQAIGQAVSAIDPKDRRAIAAARRDTEKSAKAVAAQRLAETERSVARADVAAVASELAAGFEDGLAEDFTTTIGAAIRRFGGGWLAHMQARIASGQKRMAKAGKDAAADPDAIGRLRCEQDDWVMAQLVAVERGWMVGRREQLDFETVPQAVAELPDFKPSRQVTGTDLVPIPESLASEKSMPGVAPEMAALLTELQKVEPDFKAGNYTGHGGGAWAGAGYSVDLTLGGAGARLDAKGFWQHDAAVRFLVNLDAAAKAAGASWRVLYNDFSTAEEVNHTTGKRNVVFMGNAPKGGLNWHGPSPMVLHFHLDMQFLAPAPAP